MTRYTPMEGIHVERNDGVLEITLDRPERHNAVTHDHFRHINALCQAAEDDNEVRATIITAAGDEFCTGADLRSLDLSMSGSEPPSIQTELNFFTPLLEVSKPLICVVNGVAAGGGLGLALCCDIRLASDRARFSTSFGRVGLTANDAVGWLLPRVVGVAKALELIYFARPIDASEAERIGLVSYIYPHEELRQRAAEFVGRITQAPPVATRLSKRLVLDGLERSFREHCLAQEYSSLANRVIADRDIKEGTRAFLEKREPHFTASFVALVPANVPGKASGNGTMHDG